MNSKLNLFPLFLTLSIRYNPSIQGVLRGTRNVPDTPALTYRDFDEYDLSYKKCVTKTQEILNENISKIKSKKIAIGLSGGTDSSLNTLLISKNEKISVKCFCIGFGDKNDEFDDARLVAKIANCEYREIIVKDVIKDLPLLVWKFGAPKSNLWPYYNFKAVRNLGANTTLSGEGGDELFGGYFFRYVKYLEKIPKTAYQRAKRYLFLRKRDFIQNQHNMFGSRFKKRKKLLFKSDDLITFFAKPFQNKMPYLNQIFLADFNYKLRFDFNFVDTVFAKTEGVKIESPFLQRNMISFATHIPSNYKLSNHISKMILRDILKKLGAPEHIYKKPKQGWGMRPITVWKRGLDNKCKNFLVDGNLVRDGWINKEWLKETISFVDKKKNQDAVTYPYINKLWDVLAFEIFYMQRILKESKNGVIAGW